MPDGIDNRITLQKLEILCLVVDLGGVTRAAEHLWVAQPVVSAHIRSLQERLGVTLFDREGRHMALTDAGQQAYVWAQDVLARTQQLERELLHIADGSRGPVALAASMSLGSYVLPPILSEFRERYPEADISLVVEEPQGAVASVERGESDLAFVVAPPQQNPAFSYEILGNDRLLLVAAPGFRPGLERMSVAELAEMPLVATPRTQTRRQMIDRELARFNVRATNVTIELGHSEAIKLACQAGLGAGLLFRAAVEQELEDGRLVEIEIEDADLAVPVYLVRRLATPLTPVQKAIVETIRERFATSDADDVPAESTQPVA